MPGLDLMTGAGTGDGAGAGAGAGAVCGGDTPNGFRSGDTECDCIGLITLKKQHLLDYII